MQKIKRALLRIFFSLEILIFVLVYSFGSHGLPAWISLARENNALEKQIIQLKKEVHALEVDVNNIETKDFYKECIARQSLQMARVDDYVFYYDDKKDF